MAMHPRAGQKAQQEDLHNIPALVANYFLLQPDAKNPRSQGSIRHIRSPWYR